MTTQKMTTNVSGKAVEYEFIARSELSRDEFMNLNPAVGEPHERWMAVHGQDDLDDMDDDALNAIAKTLGTARFVYRYSFV